MCKQATGDGGVESDIELPSTMMVTCLHYMFWMCFCMCSAYWIWLRLDVLVTRLHVFKPVKAHWPAETKQWLIAIVFLAGKQKLRMLERHLARLYRRPGPIAYAMFSGEHRIVRQWRDDKMQKCEKHTNNSDTACLKKMVALLLSLYRLLCWACAGCCVEPVQAAVWACTGCGFKPIQAVVFKPIQAGFWSLHFLVDSHPRLCLNHGVPL